MGSSDLLFDRQRSVHEILGGGLIADVILWRQKNITLWILMVIVVSWVVFERCGYTLLSLASSVLFLLFSILFLWSKSAALLNRPAPPLPVLNLSEEMVSELAAMFGAHVNYLLSISQDVATGKDTKLFCKVALCLLLVSVIGSLTDFLTLCYTSVIITLTIPAIYERYEYCVDHNVKIAYKKLQRSYVNIEVEFIGRIRNWISEQKKLM